MSGLLHDQLRDVNVTLVPIVLFSSLHGGSVFHQHCCVTCAPCSVLLCPMVSWLSFVESTECQLPSSSWSFFLLPFFDRSADNKLFPFFFTGESLDFTLFYFFEKELTFMNIYNLISPARFGECQPLLTQALSGPFLPSLHHRGMTVRCFLSLLAWCFYTAPLSSQQDWR